MQTAAPHPNLITPALRRAVRWVLLLNLGYFGCEFAVARAIGSVSLFADSIDFLEDSALNLLVLLALGWSARNRADSGARPGGNSARPRPRDALDRRAEFFAPLAPAPVPLSLTAFGALLVNLAAALLLARYRDHAGGLTKAAFLSARNDVLANCAIIAVGLITAFAWHSAWPDLLAGLGIAAMNADAARAVWRAARRRRKAAAFLKKSGAKNFCLRWAMGVGDDTASGPA